MRGVLGKMDGLLGRRRGRIIDRSYQVTQTATIQLKNALYPTFQNLSLAAAWIPG
jgi:hypothetical protein